MKTTLYDILGVARSASDQEIKSSWRKLCSKYHPDKFPEGSAEQLEAKERIQIINAAYTTLSDPDLRAKYDRAEQSKYADTRTSQERRDPPRQEQTHSRNTHSGGNTGRTDSRGPSLDDLDDFYARMSGRNQKNTQRTTQDDPFKDAFFRASPSGNERAGGFTGKSQQTGQGFDDDVFAELRRRMDQDKPIFDALRRQMQENKPLYDAMREDMRTNPVFTQLRKQLDEDRPSFDAMRERMKTDPIFDELRARMRRGQPSQPSTNLDLDLM